MRVEGVALVWTFTGLMLAGAPVEASRPTCLVRNSCFTRTSFTRDNADSASVSVKDFGAKGDGVADDTAAIDKAQGSLPPSGGTLYFPPGIYNVSRNGIVIRKVNLVLKATVPGSSTIMRTLNSGPIVQSSNAYREIQNVTLEGLNFSKSESSPDNWLPSISLYGDSIRGSVSISSCRFWKSGIALTGMSNVDIEGSLFNSPGNAEGDGILITGNSRNITIEKNRFLYLKNAIVVSTRNPKTNEAYTPDAFTIRDNYFDAGWWLLKEKFTGEGPSVSYTANGLVDTKAQFSNLTTTNNIPWHNVRVMPVKRSGSGILKASGLSDAKGQFITNKVRNRDIVRAGKYFGVVTGVESETSITVEEWLADSDRQPIRVPAESASYVIYGIYLGSVWSGKGSAYTTTSLTSQSGWWDFDGNRVIPPAGTRYEVLVRRPYHSIHADYGVRNITVQNNVLKRGWGDQISIYANKTTPTNAIITGNTVEDGEDMGITLHGTKNYVANNVIRHQGCGGIWTDADDSLIEKNKVYDSQWVNPTEVSCGDIILSGANRTTITNNYCERISALDRWGILIWNRTPTPTDQNVVINNDCRNHLKADIGIVTMQDGTVTNTRIQGNKGTIIDSSKSPKTSN